MKKKENKTGISLKHQILIGSVLALIIGAYLPLLYVLGQTPDYSMLEESDIEVKEVWYERGNNRGMQAVDGRKFAIRGKYDHSVIDEKLVAGTEITVKWYARKLLAPKKLFIEEIKLDGETICEYSNDNVAHAVFAMLGCGLMVGLGLCGLWYYKKSKGYK